MATITITVPDAVVARVADAFAETYGWDGKGSRSEFVARVLREHVKNVTVSHEARQAAVGAERAAANSAASAIVVT